MSASVVEAGNVIDLNLERTWETVCDSADVPANLGLRALVAGAQVAIFRVQHKLYAISAIDPFNKAAVLSRGLVSDLGGRIVVASPLYKQHFHLATGHCLEDDGVSVQTFPSARARARARFRSRFSSLKAASSMYYRAYPSPSVILTFSALFGDLGRHFFKIVQCNTFSLLRTGIVS